MVWYLPSEHQSAFTMSKSHVINCSDRPEKRYRIIIWFQLKS